MLIDSKENNGCKHKKPRIVEIVGPAGAGKTTLCKLLSLRRGVRSSNFPDVRRVANAPFFISYGLRLTPVLAHLSRPGDRQFSRREFAWLTILSGWPMILQKELKRNNSLIVLDQGPIYLLAEISEFGPDCLKSEWAEEVWERWYRQWAAMLDMVVWLDAADEYLLERIRSREKEHVVKGESARVIFDFLRRYRDVYEYILSRLATNRSGLKILRFDTTRQTPEVIANHLLAEFDLKAAPSGDWES